MDLQLDIVLPERCNCPFEGQDASPCVPRRYNYRPRAIVGGLCMEESAHTLA